MLATPEAQHLVDDVFAGPLPEVAGKSVVEHRVAERVIAEALKSADVEAEIAEIGSVAEDLNGQSSSWNRSWRAPRLNGS